MEVIPNEHSSNQAEGAADVKVSREESSAKAIELPSGQELNAAEAIGITRSSLVRIIVLAGASNSGKTTVLSSLNNCFQKGPFANYMFAGSRTLLAFEQRSHDSRISSNRQKPEAPRTITKLEDVRFLHLRVRDEGLSRPIQHLLFTDISGENFRDAKDSTEECRKLWILKRTDHFALFIDGEKLINLKRRHEAKTDSISLLRRCLDADMLGGRSYVDVLFSKYDLIDTNPEKKIALAFIDDTKKTLRTHFAGRFGRLRFFEIAAQPSAEPSLGDGYGLGNILSSWIDESQFYRSYEQPMAATHSPRQFHTFGHNIR